MQSGVQKLSEYARRVRGPIDEMPWAEHARMIALADHLVGIAGRVDKSSVDVGIVQQVFRRLSFVRRQELDCDGGNGAMPIRAPGHGFRGKTGKGERQHREMGRLHGTLHATALDYNFR